ncbi:hypothetical protein H310_06510 [Aphanomyces invadans]|uniref:Uncharacterized protein n=1 Tax=Aphanomyces invadans TaxID=157072 RepID=A0A024U8S1_9STRA|nr:hypothetical protein H310_06510 [Aphanomyces invadans]ETW01988.1 hypothetical protein H310_06510 [Aphanomyces invadans]|eukprot:XP_008869836.1 hypothetical protein H310_06510 [Aphanomyces invadans]
MVWALVKGDVGLQYTDLTKYSEVKIDALESDEGSSAGSCSSDDESHID